MLEPKTSNVIRVESGVQRSSSEENLIQQLRSHRADEIIFAVTGYAGSGTSFVINQISTYLGKSGYEPVEIKARSILEDFARRVGEDIPDADTDAITKVEMYQALGDKLRNDSGQYGAVSAYMVKKVHEARTEENEKKYVFLLDSLKHPQEVEILRHVYGDGFFLVSVGCRPDVRLKRLERKLAVDEGDGNLEELVNRDAEDSEHKYGQQVNKTFHLADYFVDNTESNENVQKFSLPDQLARFFDIVLTGTIHRPLIAERGMYHAHAASLRSSCLSRQVGASILDNMGVLLSVGANEVPRYGGGSYDELSKPDDRCFHREHCSNTKEQIKILKKLYSSLEKSGLLEGGRTFDEFEHAIKGSRIKSLLEYSRSIHAEMDALLALVRVGKKLPNGSVLFSTTYPCHNCARHIVAAGIEQVVYLEPYSKSMAIDLHGDSIADNKSDDESEGRVKFTAYNGVSPRLYERVYLKTGDLKDDAGDLLSEKEIADSFKPRNSIWTKTYLDFEQEIVQFIENSIEVRAD